MTPTNDLAERIDGVARVVMSLIADLEVREQIDGRRFCAGLRRHASGRRTSGLKRSAAVIERIADELDDAREARRSAAN